MADIQDTIGTKEQQVLIDRVAEFLSEKTKATKLVTAGQVRLALMDTMKEGMSMKKASEMDANARMQIFVNAAVTAIQNLNLDRDSTMAGLLEVYNKWKADFNK